MNANFSLRLRVRAYECDSLGHVNNSVYLQYLQQTTHAARDDAHAAENISTPRALTVEYQTPARADDELQIETWIVEADEATVTRGYEITRVADAAAIVAARMVWTRRGDAHSIPRETFRAASVKPFVVPSDNNARPFRWRHRVRRYELDATNRVALAVYFNWLEEATYDYSARVGWDIEKMRAENFIVLQYRRDTEFFGAARGDDEVEFASRLIEVRRVRGTWVHELFRAGSRELILRDYSTGAFLDWQGKVRLPPSAMMEALRRGE